MCTSSSSEMNRVCKGVFSNGACGIVQLDDEIHGVTDS